MENTIQEWLFSQRDEKYREFNAALVPNIDKDRFVGVKTPELRAYARELIREGRSEELLESLPHTYFEENQLHAFVLSECKDFEELIENLEKFLPEVDNWATCDQLRPKIFKKNKEKLLPYAIDWIQRKEHPYIVRFGIGMFMSYFLDQEFDSEYANMIGKIRSEEYYVNMMIAWYFATALAKQYEAVIPIIEERRLDPWVHNKTIQKAIESRRISPETKTYLRRLKI